MLRHFNDWVGDKISYWLSTMAAFWLVSVLVLTPLIWQRPNGLVGWMQYAISVFFQGAALPVLGYVARKSGENQERVLNETHDTVMEELALIKEELALARAERDELKTFLAKIQIPSK